MYNGGAIVKIIRQLTEVCIILFVAKAMRRYKKRRYNVGVYCRFDGVMKFGSIFTPNHCM